MDSDPSLGETTIHAGEGPVRSREGLERGQTLGRYLIIDRIGAGGMGQVYSAFDPELDRKVAIKLLHVAGGSSTSDDDAARLVREAQAMARVTHPNVITVHDVGRWGESVFVAMEFVSGGTLADWLERDREWPEIVEVFAKAAQGLAAAHHAGLIHRDFKPENVLIGEHGRVAVADFGLARLADAIAPAGATEQLDPAEQATTLSTTASSLSVQLTRTGALLGTPAYMAPEQHLRAEVDERSDQFAFCVALYEALYRQRPFGGETIAALAFQVAQGKLRPPPPGRRVPRHLERLVRRGLSRNREDRFASMDDLIAELIRDPRRDRGKWWLLGAAAGVIGLGVVLSQRAPAEGIACDGGEAEIAAVWNDDARTRLKAAFDGVDQPWAAASAERVVAHLDEYAGNWAAMHRDACEATHHAGTQSEQLLDLRMICLARRKTDLAGLTQMLGEGDADVLRKAIELSDDLPLLAPCADVEALTTRVPPPDDPAARELVEASFARLSDGRRQWKAGRLDDAHAIAVDVLAQARELDYPPLEGDALTLAAQSIEYDDRAAAEGHLTEAIDVAMRAGDDKSVAYAVSVLMRVLNNYGDRDRDREIDLWFRIGKASLARTGSEFVGTYSGLLLNHGQSLIARRDFEGAEAEIQEAYRLRLELWGDAHPDVATALRGLSMLAYRRDDLDACADYNRRALAVYEKHYGPDHPALVSTRSNLAVIQLTRGQNQDALEQLERVLAIRTAQYGEEHETTADAMGNVGIALEQLGRPAEAEPLLRRSADIYAQKTGADSVATGESLANLAAPIAAQDRHAEAAELVERAIANFEAHDGPRTYRVGHSTVVLSRERRELGQLAEARRLALRGREILAEVLGEDDARTLNATIELAYVDLAEDAPERAIDRVGGVLAKIDATDNVEVRAEARLLLARAHDRRRARALATAAAREGLEIMRAGDLQDPGLREQLSEWTDHGEGEGEDAPLPR